MLGSMAANGAGAARAEGLRGAGSAADDDFDSDDEWYVTNIDSDKRIYSDCNRIKRFIGYKKIGIKKEINFPLEQFDITKIKHMDKIIRSSKKNYDDWKYDGKFVSIYGDYH